MSTRVVMTLLVRNEEDVIAENILFHYAQGVESFLVMDICPRISVHGCKVCDFAAVSPFCSYYLYPADI